MPTLEERAREWLRKEYPMIGGHYNVLAIFARIIAEETREAAAKVADERCGGINITADPSKPKATPEEAEAWRMAVRIAASIRATPLPGEQKEERDGT